MIVAPTEPPSLRAIATTVSLKCEEYGADVMFVSQGRKVGIQRKEFQDLIASLADGRLGQQLAQMQGLDIGVLLIEGSPKWSSSGALLNASGFGSPITKAQYMGVLWSAQNMGLWTDFTGSLRETVEWIPLFQKWLSKTRHDSLFKRGKVYSAWGTPGNRDFQRHLLMGIPGIGASMADKIIDGIGFPLKLGVGETELLGIPGLGKGKVRKIMEVFEA